MHKKKPRPATLVSLPAVLPERRERVADCEILLRTKIASNYYETSHESMRKSLGIVLAVAAVTAICGLFVCGADETTLNGTSACAKCLLHETDTCQPFIQVKRGDGVINYYLVQNSVSEGIHEVLCKEIKKVKAKGILKKVNGRMEFTASHIKLF
jgi:hypothetical protein